MYLVKFEIKNRDFPYENYGLDSPSFLMDVDKTFAHNKNIQTTSQPVLDGTTRMFHVSKEPGNISISGVIGELRYGGNEKENMYIKPRTTQSRIRTKDKVIITDVKTRLQLQRELLNDLRDNAIFLDIHVQDGTSVYKDYIIKNVSENASDFGKLDISLTLEEVLLFDFPEETSIGTSYEWVEDPLTPQNIIRNIQLELANTDEINVRVAITYMINQLKNLEGAVYIVGNSPDTAYRPHSFTKVVKIRASRSISSVSDRYNKVTTDSSEYRYKIGDDGIVFTTESISSYTSDRQYGGRFIFKILTTVDENNLSTLIYQRVFVDDFTNAQNLTFNIRKGKGEFSGLANKNFAHVDFNNGGSYFVGSNIITHSKKDPLEKGWCFLRKKKNSTAWHALPNLLGNANTEKKGYLYNASFLTYGIRLAPGENAIEGYELYPTFIWIEPRVWAEIKKKLVAIQKNNPNFELNVSSLP